MQLESYQDPYIERETGGRHGQYVGSYRYAGGLMEVHFFVSATSGERTALVTVSPGLPQAVVYQVLLAAEEIDARFRDARVILNPNSMPRTGSY